MRLSVFWTMVGISMVLNIGFCYNFILTLDFLKLGLVKPHMEQDEYGILHSMLDSW